MSVQRILRVASCLTPMRVSPSFLTVAALLSAVFLSSACKRRPLTVGDNNVQVNISIDYDIVNWPDPEEPGMMRVMFFDAGDGGFASHAFLPASGGRVNVLPGRTYHVLAYNFDTESTIVEDEYLWHGIHATTNEVPESYKSRLKSRATKFEDELIVYEPDHIFVGIVPDVYVPARSVDAPPVVIDIQARSIVETWLVYIDRIQGMEYVASVAGVISGMSLSNTISYDKQSEAQASVFFESMHYEAGGEVDIRFNTFGDNPAFRQTLSLVVTDIGGTAHIFNFDVSDQFVDNPEQIIYINTDKIIIEEPESVDDSGGGLAPDVDEWQDVEIDIEI